MASNNTSNSINLIQGNYVPTHGLSLDGTNDYAQSATTNMHDTHDGCSRFTFAIEFKFNETGNLGTHDQAHLAQLGAQTATTGKSGFEIYTHYTGFYIAWDGGIERLSESSTDHWSRAGQTRAYEITPEGVNGSWGAHGGTSMCEEWMTLIFSWDKDMNGGKLKVMHPHLPSPMLGEQTHTAVALSYDAANNMGSPANFTLGSWRYLTTQGAYYGQYTISKVAYWSAYMDDFLMEQIVRASNLDWSSLGTFFGPQAAYNHKDSSNLGGSVNGYTSANGGVDIDTKIEHYYTFQDEGGGVSDNREDRGNGTDDDLTEANGASYTSLAFNDTSMLGKFPEHQ